MISMELTSPVSYMGNDIRKWAESNQNTNEGDILKEKNINTNNNNEYPLFESLIQSN